jgi:hypothetical protein
MLSRIWRTAGTARAGRGRGSGPGAVTGGPGAVTGGPEERPAWDLPLADAVAEARRLRGGRCPPEWAALLDLLARVDPTPIARSADALAVQRVSSVDLHSILPGVSGLRGVSFAPNGRRMVITTCADASTPWETLSVIELPDGRATIAYDTWRSESRCQLDLGDAVLACTGHGLLKFTFRDRHGRALWGRDIRDMGEVRSLAHHPGGFVALGSDLLRFCTADGQVIRDVSLSRDLKLPGHPRLVTTDADGGRLAVAGTDLWVLDGYATRVLASRRGRPLVEHACFPGPELLTVTESDGFARTYRQASGRLELLAEKRLGTAHIHPMGAPVAALRSGEVALADAREGIQFTDARTLARIDTPGTDERPDGPSRHGRVWASPDGRYCAIHRSGPVIHITPGRRAAALAALARRPIADMSPADLAVVAAAVRGTPADAVERPFLDLLREYLERRFGTEVAGGPAGSVASGADASALPHDDSGGTGARPDDEA